MPIHASFWVFFGFDPLDGTQYQPISQKLNVWVIMVQRCINYADILSVVVPEKLPAQKRCDEEDNEEEGEHECFGIFDVFLK